MVHISIEGGPVEALTFTQISTSKLVSSLRELYPGSEMEPIVIPDAQRYPPASLSLLCAYFRADRSAADFDDQFFRPFIGNPHAVLGMMNIASFLDCPELLKVTQIAFCNHYIKGKTAATCLETLGLPGNTVFTPDEIADTHRAFPWLCMKHLGGQPNLNHKNT